MAAVVSTLMDRWLVFLTRFANRVEVIIFSLTESSGELLKGIEEIDS
jgi:hypothetical protein